MTPKTKTSIALLLLSALGLVLGALVLPWWTGLVSGGSFEIDLRNMTMCIHDACGEPKALAASDASAAPWAKVGIATLASSLVATLLVLELAVRLMMATTLGVLPWLTGVLAFFAGLLGAIFIWAHPDFGEWTPSFGMACTLAGSMGAAIASIVCATGSARTSESS
ncbi:MAG: hypothetical protein GY811_26865 [Myxococcales bacterium]|nr:hypothetical protein [Myxococcales bacterium]